MEGQRGETVPGLAGTGDDPRVLHGTPTEYPPDVQLADRLPAGAVPVQSPGADELPEQRELVGQAGMGSVGVEGRHEWVGGSLLSHGRGGTDPCSAAAQLEDQDLRRRTSSPASASTASTATSPQNTIPAVRSPQAWDAAPSPTTGSEMAT